MRDRPPSGGLTDGDSEDLAGVAVLCFGADGLVVEHRDYCNRR